ncbi:sigma-54-dependent Fis family transcriptional regulator [Serratia odorifera]|uniref:sigma-54-dependent Fis family transcriptional regulator n=1 Tax=Serratia odorifera TaxID=618 RepID=UPI003531C85F
MLPKLPPVDAGLVADRDNRSLTRPLSDSWRRSQLYGLARSDERIPFVRPRALNEIRDRNGWVSQLAQPLLARFADAINQQPSVMVISDASGLVLETCGNGGFLHQASQLSLSPGNLWGERERGTNAIGTALALGGLCEVNGGEHYLQSNAALRCSAVPIFQPDGQIAGVLDISTPAQAPYGKAGSILLQAARHIEHQWLKSTITAAHWVLRLHKDARILGSEHELVLVFCDDLLSGANRLAMQEFRLTPAAVGHCRFADLFPALACQALDIPRQTLAVNNRRYYALLDAPTRQAWAVRSLPPSPDPQAADRQKALRILNAGLALCVTGETGCGKEHFSRQLYQDSKWRSGRFVAINCAALPEPLIESELFGYAPGAFTGASAKGYMGKIREADGGVLFLDEIGDMPLSVQTRLLRVLQEKTVTPLGSRQMHKVDFALICATHRSLEQRVATGAFRDDLLYRIQEFSVRVPPLRERPQRKAFIQQLWHRLGAEQRGITLTQEVVTTLADHPWPGNVRQLLSTLKVLLALADDNQAVMLHHLPEQFHPTHRNAELPVAQTPTTPDLYDAVKQANGNISLAARRLGIARSTLYRQLQRKRSGAAG